MSADLRRGGIVVLDYGSQYTQVIARRVRELGVYAEVMPFDAAPDHVMACAPPRTDPLRRTTQRLRRRRPGFAGVRTEQQFADTGHLLRDAGLDAGIRWRGRLRHRT